MSWLLSPDGVVKINFDASVMNDKVVAGYVIRDHNAVMLWVRDKLLQSIFIPYVELTATWLGARVEVQ